jgi:hypothetical protein
VYDVVLAEKQLEGLIGPNVWTQWTSWKSVTEEHRIRAAVKQELEKLLNSQPVGLNFFQRENVTLYYRFGWNKDFFFLILFCF